jgi:hypothetical protein
MEPQNFEKILIYKILHSGAVRNIDVEIAGHHRV